MKRASFFLAVIAIVTASWSHAQNSTAYTYEYFTYVGGNPYDPYNYQMIWDYPPCSGRDKLCAIRIQIDWSMFLPDYNALQSLGIESFGFSYPGSFPDGTIMFKPNY